MSTHITLRKPLLTLAIATGMLAASAPAWALLTDSSQPLSITAAVLEPVATVHANITADKTGVRLEWKNPRPDDNKNHPAVLGFQVERAEVTTQHTPRTSQDVAWAPLAANATITCETKTHSCFLIDTNVNNATTYSYRVISTRYRWRGEPSKPVTITYTGPNKHTNPLPQPDKSTSPDRDGSPTPPSSSSSSSPSVPTRSSEPIRSVPHEKPKPLPTLASTAPLNPTSSTDTVAEASAQ